MPIAIELRQVLAELRQVLAELSLVSHAPAQNLGGSRDSSKDIGGNKPTGGIDHQGDYEPDYKLKSVDHFCRRIQRAKTEGDLEVILIDARSALKAWKCPGPPPGIEPEHGTLAWKRMIANSKETAERLAHKHEIGIRTVYRYRAMYSA